MNENVEILEYIYQNAKMGAENLTSLIKILNEKNNKIKKIIEEELKEYENFIKDTIQSILNQTYQDWELIVIDDCSTDNSVEVIKSFKDDRIKLIVNEKNLGLAATVRRGIENATGRHF